MDNIPYIVFGNEELESNPSAGKYIECKKCDKKHKITFGKSRSYDYAAGKNGPWRKSKTLGFYKCKGKTYLASIAGHLI